MTNVVYDPSFLKKYQEFHAAYGYKAPEKWKAWIKSTKLNPELPLEPQLAKKIGVEAPKEVKQTGTPITTVDARTRGAEVEVDVEEYSKQINRAWDNVQGRMPTPEERKQGVIGMVPISKPTPVTVWKDLKNIIRGEKE